MRNMFILLAVLAVMVTAQARGQNAAHAPKLVCEEPVFDFGELENTRNVDHVFVLKNDGDLTLEITNIKPTCGCTVANISQRSIPPGESARLAATLNLRGRQGLQQKPIVIESNDPKMPVMSLILKGTAIAEVQLKPSQLFFGRIGADAAVTGVVEVALQNTNSFKLVDVRPDSQFLSAEIQVTPDGRKQSIVVTTLPPLPKGTLRGNVKVQTDHPRHAFMDFAVSAFVVGEVVVVPEEISLVGTENERVTRYLTIRSETGRPFQLEAVESSIPDVETSIVPLGQSGYRVELRNLPIDRALDGQVVTLRTSINSTREIFVPIRVSLPVQSEQ